MKVNSNLQLNTVNGLSGAYYTGINKGLYSSGKDTFQKNNNVTSSKHTIPNNLLNIFAPKQILNAYANEKSVDSLANSNSKVKDILDANGVEYAVHPENIRNIQNSHLSTTTAFALKIANEMKLSQADKMALEQACVFHDFGKILIPKEILNKPGRLNSEEKEIMDLHAELGYELLSTTGMNKRTLELIKNHHKPQESNDVLCHILSVADIYSALREERPYKAPFTQQEAFEILDQKAENGEVSTEVVEALKASLTSYTNAA